MSDFGALLSTDYGFKRQGKSAPMAPPKPNPNPNPNPNTPFNFDLGGSKSTSSSPNHFSDLRGFNDVVSGGRSKSTGVNNSSVDNIFAGGVGSGDSGHGFSSLPVFDKPVYDDEDPGSGKYADMFSSSSTVKKVDGFDELLGGFSRKETRPATKSKGGADKSSPNFDDLLPGFGATSTNRKSVDATKKNSNVTNDPFVVLESSSPPTSSSSGIFSDPLEGIGKFNKSSRKKVENHASGGVFDDIDPLDSFRKSVPVFAADVNRGEKDASPMGNRPRASVRQTSVSQKSSVRSPERVSTKKMPMDDYRVSPQSVFEMPSVSADSHCSRRNTSPPAYKSSRSRETNSYPHAQSDENVGSSGDIWLTVSEIPLFTQPTSAPPPSRPPPPKPARFSKAESRSFPTSNAQKKGSSGPTPHFQSGKSEATGARGSNASPIDELEDFAMARTHSNIDGNSHLPMGEGFETNSGAAAAIREAVDKAEAKFRQVRGVRESARVSKSRESTKIEKEEKVAQEAEERKFKENQSRLEHERLQRERDEEKRRQREEEEKRQEEKEREKRRIERERELARQAVDRAAREARERAAAEARSRAERVAVQKAQAEARGRAEKAAVQRVQAEARERAASEAKERAEKAASEARDRARGEAKEKEVRERTAATAARANQQKNENYLESFFGTGSSASSAPRPTSEASTQFQSKPTEATRTSVNSSSNTRKASSSTNIVDDLSSIFGGPPSSGDFQEVEGETEERRRARLERHQRTQERAAKALAEKNNRDLEAQREQTERHRIGETLDFEIKRWAVGKEGNLRALLSTMQYVLWPECGWQPISLTDLITGAAVKKAYRKATLCIHPDKVQQKGATLQQKYIAEKVFDLLKEAWNKFNSEELF